MGGHAVYNTDPLFTERDAFGRSAQLCLEPNVCLDTALTYLLSHMQASVGERGEQYCKRCRTSKPAAAFTAGYRQCDACRADQRQRSRVSILMTTSTIKVPSELALQGCTAAAAADHHPVVSCPANQQQAVWRRLYW